MAGEDQLGTLVSVVAVAVLAPIVADLPPKLRLPAVVAETALGIVIGPRLLGLVEMNLLLAFFGTLGMAFLFFLAGLELDLGRIRGKPLTLAMSGWASRSCSGWGSARRSRRSGSWCRAC